MIRACRTSDAARICEIYNHYVENTVVTFEETPLSVPEMTHRIDGVAARFPWLVWEDERTVVGYACATPWKERSAYRFAVESTVYLAPAQVGRGIGSALYGALIAELRKLEMHCVFGGIALPNEASVALHEKLGFRKIGHFVEVGWKLRRWVDVGYWELVL